MDKDLRKDLLFGLAIVLLAILGVLTLGLLVFGPPVWAQAPNPPVIVRVDRDTEARAPDGTNVFLPAGSEISACGPEPWDHVHATRVLHVPTPRRARPCALFCDSFETREKC
jgi:hypothetical protein